MTWTLADSGTTSALTIGTETTLATDTGNGTFVLEVDTSNLALGDLLEIRIYTTTLLGGAMAQVLKGTYQHKQVNNHKVSFMVASDQAIKCTLKQLTGTGRTFSWKMLSIGVGAGGGGNPGPVSLFGYMMSSVSMQPGLATGGGGGTSAPWWLGIPY